MRILFVSSTFPETPEESLDWIGEFTKTIVEKGHKVMVLASHTAGTQKEQVFNKMKIKRFQYFWPSSLQKVAYGEGIAENTKKSLLAKTQLLLYVISNTFAVRKAVKEFKPDIVQALWSFPQGWAAALIKKEFGFPLAIHLFGAEVYLAKNYGMPSLARWPTKHAELVTANSQATKEAALEIGIKKSMKILFYGGIDTKKFNPKNSGKKLRKELGLEKEPMIFALGRIVERKGFIYLVRAMPLILKKFPKAKLVIGSTGPEKEKIEKEANKLKVEKSVIFAGRIPNNSLTEYYAACSVFCLPAIVDSRGETEGGQGVVIGEAMATGKPVVASDIGGIPDAVKHNLNGLLVEQKNPKQLANAICKILSDKKLSERLSKAGRNFDEKELSYETLAGKFIAEYEKVLSAGKESK